MRKRILAAVVAGVVTAGTAVPATAVTHTGYASDQTEHTSATARVVVSDATSTMTGTRKQIDVYYTYSGLSLDLMSYDSVTIQSLSGFYYEVADLSLVSPTHERGYFLVKGTDPVGTYFLDLSATAGVGYDDPDLGRTEDYLSLDKEHVTAIAVRRNTVTSFNATPEPASRGHYTHATGHVNKLVPYDYGLSSHYVHATYGTVHVYFDPAGAAPAKYVTWAPVDSAGNFTRSVKVTQSGTWSAAYFPGGSTYAVSSSNTDWVSAK